ncbi:CPBP family intramembrane metalloprotease [Flavobacterium longum]|uniref:CPBP family intramembrane glutamic endopeptidase n=1 Tax=Flavobacterium longum TaxID=1299340 RepID=UPI0039EBE048
MPLKLRDYYPNTLFQISWPAFIGLLLLLLAETGFYVWYLHDAPPMARIVSASDGNITAGMIRNLYVIPVFYFLFSRYRTSRVKWPWFRNNLESAIIILILSVFAFFVVSPFYEKTDLLLVPGGPDYIDLFLSAVYEEVLFRYFILGMFFILLRGHSVLWRLWLSVFGTTLVFVAAHFFSTYQNGAINLFNYVGLALFSIGTCWIYIKYSNLLLVVYVHFIGNFILNFLPLKTPGYSAGFLFLIFTLVLLAGQGNRIKRHLRSFLKKSQQTVANQRVRMSNWQRKMPV